MALTEFVAMESAYRALQQLDLAARGRALHWLTDALAVPGALPQQAAVTGTADDVVAAPAAIKAAPAATKAALATVDVAPAADAVPAVAEQAATVRRSPRRAAVAKSGGGRRSVGSTEPRIRGGRGAKAATRSRAAASSERAYRKMPEASEVMAAYRQVGTISGLAEHYQVPRHTAQGWARRLRSQGHDIGRSA
jgi:hypothetical protein